MACRFSFVCLRNPGKQSRSRNSHEVTFQSKDGQEYYVQYNSDEYPSVFNIKSDADINAVVMMEIYQEDSDKSDSDSYNYPPKHCFYVNASERDAGETKARFVRGNKTSFYFKNVLYQSNICVVNVIPLQEAQSINPSAVDKSMVRKMVPVKKEQVVEKKFDQLSADMQNLLLNGNLSDVVLSDGSTDFRAHKVVLSARSSVFAKMFQHPMKESCENRVSMSDISADVLKEMLSYIYTGIARIMEDKMARNLYVVADKYDIKDLRDVCSVYLKNVNLESVLDTLILADLYEDKTLKQFTMDFIAKNFSLVKSHKSWAIFIKENQTLTIELLSFVVEKK